MASPVVHTPELPEIAQEAEKTPEILQEAFGAEIGVAEG
jgi:hypothetical protein